jgi:UDP-N-acetyl-D-mannosaminuronate dehydrogenase
VTVLGISYRANVKETRYSPAIELIDALKRRGSRVIVYDPKYVYAEIRSMGYDSEATFEAAVSDAECVILTVGHDEFKSVDPKNLAALTAKGCVVVDAASILDPKAVEKVGLIYRGVGRGVWTK